MIHDKKEFGIGLVLIALFFVALAGIFMPWFEGGKNTLNYMDSLFNAISKHSAYYIPDLVDKAGKHQGEAVTLTVKAADAAQAGRLQTLYSASGAEVIQGREMLQVTADLGLVLQAVLADADLMYQNEGDAVAEKYASDGRRVLLDWHQALAKMIKELNRQENFAAAKTLRDVQTKALEPAYNYFGIVAEPMAGNLWVTLLALAGYVLYTIWYGFAILFLFEGWGLRLEH